MSRDWTPREVLAVEQLQISEGLGNYFDFLRNSHWMIDGEKVPLCTEEEITLRQSYPTLGKLMDNFAELHAQLSTIPGGLEFLSIKDKELSEYATQEIGDPTSPLIRWFEGKLDPNFYYRQYNNELLLEALVTEAKEQARFTPEPLSDRLDSAKREAGANTSVRKETSRDDGR